MNSKILISILTVSAFTFACAGGGGGTGGGTGGSGGAGGAGGSGEVIFKAQGKASIHPVAAQVLADAGTIDGLYLRVEEPLKVALNDPLGYFGTVTLDNTGAFEVKDISSELVNLGVAAGVVETLDGGAVTRVVRTATVIFDVALEQAKPSKDILNAKSYAVPVAFHDKLTAAVTPAKIGMIASGKSTLISSGFILGQVVDSAGKPVAGAKISTTPAALADNVFYPTADVSSTGPSTSSNGLFVYVHTGADVATFRFNVEGKPEYKQRNAGAAKDACLVVTVYPGTTAP